LDASAWLPHFNAQYYEGDWSGIALRSPGGSVALYPDPNPSQPYAATEHLIASPRLRAALDRFDCALSSVRVLRLGPGARVREHRDYQIGLEFGEVRLHVPLETSPEAEFVIDGAPLIAAAGECWYVDVTKPHRVANRGSRARLHLVIDCVVDPWLRDLLDDAAARLTFARLQMLVERDSAICAELWNQTDHAAFVQRAVQLAGEHGLSLRAQDIEAAMADGRRRWHDAQCG